MANPFRRIGLFWQETLAELKKAAWPSKAELKSSTIVVLVAIAVGGVYISLADFSVYTWVALFAEMAKN